MNAKLTSELQEQQSVHIESSFLSKGLNHSHSLKQLDRAATRFMSQYGLRLLSISMGLVFVWFGALKLQSGISPAELDYQKRLIASQMIVSMSCIGNCWDNAPIKSFWEILKLECADVVFASHSQARCELFSYIVGFYNRQRRHSSLGYVSPSTFESQSERLSFTLFL